MTQNELDCIWEKGPFCTFGSCLPWRVSLCIRDSDPFKLPVAKLDEGYPLHSYEKHWLIRCIACTFLDGGCGIPPREEPHLDCLFNLMFNLCGYPIPVQLFMEAYMPISTKPTMQLSPFSLDYLSYFSCTSLDYLCAIPPSKPQMGRGAGYVCKLFGSTNFACCSLLWKTIKYQTRQVAACKISRFL
ncbi:hypothetical protein CTI12_AA044960 [Artemisia annua]|uniref:Uncharacterized protein n=1 Tax=Artemisia annua TaxID=35608 RepID=A0A2U1QCZ6_ARTAN|nr:hypothetical protein CTI12_AA044960 [Artemisia annua]